MAKEKFNWKSLFVNEQSDTIDNNKPAAKTSFPKENNLKFPEQSSSVKPTLTNKDVNSGVLDSVIEMYEKGFDSLNLPGYDFYEFFKAIKAVNSEDPSIYKMAITMAQSTDSKVTKDSLLQGSNFYIDEINKVHKLYEDKGSSKKEKIINNQLDKKNSLISEIAVVEKQILKLQNELSSKKIKLEATDDSYMNEVSEIDQKIIANNIAKDKILQTITSVVEGIKVNL